MELWLKMLACRRLVMRSIHTCAPPSGGGSYEHCIHGRPVVNDFCFACFEELLPEVVKGLKEI